MVEGELLAPAPALRPALTKSPAHDGRLRGSQKLGINRLGYLDREMEVRECRSVQSEGRSTVRVERKSLSANTVWVEEKLNRDSKERPGGR